MQKEVIVMAEKLEDVILRQQPFRSILIIKKVISLKTEKAISGETFKVISNRGMPFKLRYCRKLSQARAIERNVKMLPKAFPRFYGREGRYLLFDWIDGENLTKDASPEDCYTIGKMMGEAHALEDVDSKRKLDQFFNPILELIGKNLVFNKKELAQIRVKYEKFKKKLKIDIVLEFNDVHGQNLIKDRRGRIYFIDEEGFGHRIKGLGFAKLFMAPKEWMKKPEQQEAFWRGYKEHHSNDYFDKDYQELILFIQLIRSIATRIKTNQDVTMLKKQLLRML